MGRRGRLADAMDLVTCPQVSCRYNGFGECQLGAVLAGLAAGVVSDEACPYFTPVGDGEEGEDG